MGAAVDTSPLLEREPELARLESALDDARHGHGRVALVEGHAGIGKSRLLEELVRAASRLGVRVLGARGSELEADVPFGVVAQLLEPAVAAASPTEREVLLADAAGLAAPLLVGGGTSEGPGDAHGLRHGLFWVVSNLAERGPLLLCVDDVQWADEASLRWVVHLAQRIESLPVALALASQPAEGAAAALLEHLAADGRSVRVLPRPLTGEAVAHIVSERLERPPEEEFTQACVEATGGNPFLVTELARALAADGVPPRDAIAPRVSRLATESVARAVLVRLRRLGGGATPLARAAAVLGDGSSLRHAARIAGLDVAAAASAADALAGAGILRSGEPLAFVHSIVRASIHAELPRAERGRLHGRAARLLADDGFPAERVSAHLLKSSPDGAPWVVETLRAAADRARARGAPRAAARYLRRALAEPPPRERRAEILMALGEAEAAAGDRHAVERFEEAADLSEQPHDRASALEAAGRALEAAGQPRRAAETFDRAREQLGDGARNGKRELALRLEADWITVTRLDPALRPRALSRLERLRSETPDPATHAGRALLAHAAHEAALAGRSADEARRLALRALGEDELAAGALTRRLALGALMWADDLDEAKRRLDLMVDDARRSGSVTMFKIASHFRAHVQYRRGDVAAALADTEVLSGESAGTPAKPVATRRSWPAGLAVAGHAYIDRGELERAALQIAPLGEERALDALTVAELVALRGRLRLVQGRPRLAQQDFLECGRRLDELGAHSPSVVPWRSSAALAAAALGDAEEARHLAGEELERARAAGLARATGLALRVAALVEDPASPRRRELLRDAVDELERAGDRLTLAAAHVDLGAALRQAGEGQRGQEALQRGLELASQVGAVALARRARDELHGAGERPGKRGSAAGAAALTPSERRVAELAAQGLTNRQIAQSLFVTVKTVEWHLRNAFVKLRITSRRELRGVLREAA